MPNNEIIQLQLPWGWSLPSGPQLRTQDAHTLYVTIEADGAYKIGTCEHCVLQEQGRPERAWDADVDADLDFDRDRYFALLTHFGLCLTDQHAYVCP